MDNQIFVNSSKESNVVIPTDILDDLSSRFIINVPEEERCTIIRTCFQIELAHWFYLDFYCVERPDLPVCTIRNFARLIFNHIPSLRQHAAQADSIIASWKGYKHSVPTYGAILLDESLENVLLVQGYYARTNWSFPKGKVNKEEQPHVCAVREVLEETGFDISSFIHSEEYLTHYLHDQLIKLYIVSGIPKDTMFQPITRHEIKKIQWFPVKDLPVSRKEPNAKPHGLPTNSFFMVIPFVKGIKKWIIKKLGYDPYEVSEVEHAATSKAQFPLKPQTESEDHVTMQRNIFAQLSANTLSSYFPVKDSNNKHKDQPQQPPPPRNSRSAYTPPPRMLKQMKQNAEFSRSKTFRPSPENKIEITSSQFARRVLAFPMRDNPKKGNKSNEAMFRSSTWDNFHLDSKALIACFNVNMMNAFYELNQERS